MPEQSPIILDINGKDIQVEGAVSGRKVARRWWNVQHCPGAPFLSHGHVGVPALLRSGG